MTYVALYQQPGFRQSVPSDGTWKPVNSHNSSGRAWQNVDTGETIVCPAIWYTLPGSEYAKTLRFNADRSDQVATLKADEGKPWSTREAERSRQDARRLRAMATLCERFPDTPAGSIDFRGLSDPTTPDSVLDCVVTEIEAGN